MSMELTITNAGRAAIVDAQSGGFSNVLITKVAFGSVAHQPTPAATQLMAEIKRISSVSGAQTAEDTIHLTAVDNSGDEYSVREIGFYTNTGVLLGICSAPDTLIIEKSAVSSLFIAFDLTLQPDDAAVIEFGNTDFLLPAATTTTEGAMRFANTAERLALTANNVAMTPAGVKQAINAETAAAAVKLSSARTFQTTGDATGSASSDLAAGVSISLTLAGTGVTAGSYQQVTVDSKGRVTGGSNPTTLAGYGITDAVPSSRTITAGTGLSGGGSLGANRTLDVLYGTSAGTAAQGNDSRIVNALQTSQRSAANGVAALDANAKVPLSQIPDSVVGQVEYMGTWNAASNTPTLPTTPAEKGHYYVVTTAGTQFGHAFAVGDWCISDGSKWDKVDNTDAVSSVNGRTGAVTGLVESSDSRLTNAREWSAETVSQAEAEGGTGTTRRAWTSQRIRQAVATANAATATKLATARTITVAGAMDGSATFDGAANATITVRKKVGEFYIQFPGASAPSTLFGGTWAARFETEGIFFRTPGGNALSFNGGIQSDAIRNITGSITAKEGNAGSQMGFSSSSIKSGAMTLTNVRSEQSVQITSGNFSVGDLAIDASLSVPTASENRPKNRTIRVWELIAI